MIDASIVTANIARCTVPVTPAFHLGHALIVLAHEAGGAVRVYLTGTYKLAVAIKAEVHGRAIGVDKAHGAISREAQGVGARLPGWTAGSIATVGRHRTEDTKAICAEHPLLAITIHLTFRRPGHTSTGHAMLIRFAVGVCRALRRIHAATV